MEKHFLSMNMQSSRGYKKNKSMRKGQTHSTHNMQKYLQKRIFTCQKTEPNEIGWQTAITTTTSVTTTTSTWTGRKSFLAKSICIGNRLVPVAHNAKYAANKSKLTNTNSGGGVARTVHGRRGRGRGRGWGSQASRGHRMGALEHATAEQQHQQHGAPEGWAESSKNSSLPPAPPRRTPAALCLSQC